MGRFSIACTAAVVITFIAITSARAAYSRAGWTADLVENELGVDGYVTIVDDHTINVTDFSYTGDGLPYVYFRLGADNTYASFDTGMSIGSNLYGTNWSHVDIGNIDVPSGLDGYGAISVWCQEAHVNFGSGAFIVPEPASLLLLLGACPVVLRRRRTRMSVTVG